MYGNTENACYALANALAKRNIKNIKMFDVSKTDISYLISDVFRTKTIVIASPTYNGGLYPKMENFLTDLNALNVQNKHVAIIENGTWAITASKLIKKHLEPLKNITLINKELRISSNLCNNQKLIIDEMADEIGKSLEA
jgi:flavorubredoxin